MVKCIGLCPRDQTQWHINRHATIQGHVRLVLIEKRLKQDAFVASVQVCRHGGKYGLVGSFFMRSTERVTVSALYF